METQDQVANPNALDSLTVGSLVGGKFRVDSPLGAGGMGIVYRAVHQELQHPVAVKIMRPEFTSNERIVSRFFTEARIGACLKSEHSVHVLDVGRLDDGQPYMVIELLEGADLYALLKEHGRVSAASAVNCALQACEALAEAHAIGIVHRDIKPENLFLSRRADGSLCLKVLDFGVSKDVTLTGSRSFTNPAEGVGSPHYMAPEQMIDPSRVDERADIWSLGVVMFELLSGINPFEAPTAQAVCAKVLCARPPVLQQLAPELPEGLCSIIQRCMQQDPDTRFRNVIQLANALERYASTTSRGSARRVRRVYQARRSDGRPKLVAAETAAGSTDADQHAETRVDLAPPERVAPIDTNGNMRRSTGNGTPPVARDLATPQPKKRRRDLAAVGVSTLIAGVAGTVAVAAALGFRFSEPYGWPQLAQEPTLASVTTKVQANSIPVAVQLRNGIAEPEMPLMVFEEDGHRQGSATSQLNAAPSISTKNSANSEPFASEPFPTEPVATDDSAVKQTPNPPIGPGSATDSAPESEGVPSDMDPAPAPADEPEALPGEEAGESEAEDVEVNLVEDEGESGSQGEPLPTPEDLP